MPAILTRLVLPALVVALPGCAASAAGVPASLVGDWFNGAQLPGEAYDAPSRANANSARFVFNKDGTYEFRTFVVTVLAS